MQELREQLESLVGNVWLARLAAILIALLVAALLGRLLSRLVIHAVTRWMTPWDTEKDKRFDRKVETLKTPLRWFLFALLLQAVLPVVVGSNLGGMLGHGALVFSIAAGGWAVLRLLAVIEEAMLLQFDINNPNNLEARRRHTQMRGFHNISTFLVLLVTFAFILLTFERVRQLGAGLLASAGVAGVILGFAAQRSISTIVAGVQIALTQPIRLDDVVIVEGEWGRIEEITLTYVVVRIWDLRRLVVPITYFIERPFQNWTRVSAELLGAVELHVDYSVPVDAIRAEAKRVLESSSAWDGKVFSVQVVASDSRAMVVRPLFSAKDSSDQWNLRCEMREKLIAFLQREYPECLPRIRAEVHSLGERTAEPNATATEIK